MNLIHTCCFAIITFENVQLKIKTNLRHSNPSVSCRMLLSNYRRFQGSKFLSSYGINQKKKKTRPRNYYTEASGYLYGVKEVNENYKNDVSMSIHQQKQTNIVPASQKC